jgi:SAM-dependent methyltransferase
VTEKPYVFGGTRHEAELERLRTLERAFDPGTRAYLRATGLREGGRCLEVGAGAGSVARWLSEVAGPSGRVLAIDLNTRFLSGFAGANLEVREADVRDADVEPGSFDLAHARFVLIHVPDWAAALAAMVRCLKPGGWLVLEEPDFSSSRSLSGPAELRRAFDNVHRATEAMFRQRGLDHAFGARLPALLLERGFEAIAVENDAPVVPGGSPLARMMGLSTEQLRDKYVATGLVTERDIEFYGSFAAEPTCCATYHATVRASGRKPGARGAG